jgi:hypothetical protein
MKKLAIFSEESVFSNNIKCGVAEVVDTLAISLANLYEVNIVCYTENTTIANALSTLEKREGYYFGRF